MSTVIEEQLFQCSTRSLVEALLTVKGCRPLSSVTPQMAALPMRAGRGPSRAAALLTRRLGKPSSRPPRRPRVAFSSDASPAASLSSGLPLQRFPRPGVSRSGFPYLGPRRRGDRRRDRGDPLQREREAPGRRPRASLFGASTAEWPGAAACTSMTGTVACTSMTGRPEGLPLRRLHGCVAWCSSLYQYGSACGSACVSRSRRERRSARVEVFLARAVRPGARRAARPRGSPSGPGGRQSPWKLERSPCNDLVSFSAVMKDSRPS
jgi:hypothetical protein